MSTVVSVNPFHCRMWELHDRMECYVTEESCRDEIESFAKCGQLVPVLGRPIHGDPKCKVELIYGARRLFVARHLGQPLLVELRDISDMEAIVSMDIENRQRCDISPYERGLSFLHWLRSGRFRSQDQIAKMLKISPSLVCRLIKLAQLPAVVVDAFPTPKDICERWGIELARMMEDPASRSAVVHEARRIAQNQPRPSGEEVFRQLRRAGRSGAPAGRSRDEVVTGDAGELLFRLRERGNSIMLIVPVARLRGGALAHLRSAAASILQRASTQVIDRHPVAVARASTEETAGRAVEVTLE